MIKFDATKEAKKLKEKTRVVEMHRTMDGALNGYSVIKSAFDFQHCTEGQMDSLDAMHEWIMTPTGLAVALGSSLIFTGIANRASIDEKSSLGQTWKFTREGLQAGRNGFKAVRGAIFTASAFTAKNLKYLILPSSLSLGGVYLLSRLYMMTVNDERKKMIEKNNLLFAHIMNFGTIVECNTTIESTAGCSFKDRYVLLNQEKLKFIYYDNQGKSSPVCNRYVITQDLKKNQELLYYVDNKGNAELIKNVNISNIKEVIKKTGSRHLSLLQLDELLPPGKARQHFNAFKEQKAENTHPTKRKLLYLIRAFNGLIDGLYLYLGVVLLVSTLTPHMLLFLTILSTIYCLLCIASRVYEEYQSQHQLDITEHKIGLARKAKELELFLIKLNKITLLISLEKDPIALEELQLKQKKLDKELDEHLQQFENERKRLRKAYHLSNTETILLGIKHSLPFYGALISFTVFISFILFVAGTTFPPSLIMGCVLAGIPILALGIYDAFVRRKNLPQNLTNEEKKQASELGKIVQAVKDSYKVTYENGHEEYHAFLKRAYAKQAFLDWIVQGLQADPLADTFYADTAEIIRSFWAGLLKGRKAIEMLFNRLQQRDETHHYQDTFVMLILMIPVGILYAFIFAGNAFIKGFTRKEETKNYEEQTLNINFLEKQKHQYSKNKREETPTATDKKPLAGNQITIKNHHKVPANNQQDTIEPTTAQPKSNDLSIKVPKEKEAPKQSNVSISQATPTESLPKQTTDDIKKKEPQNDKPTTSNTKPPLNITVPNHQGRIQKFGLFPSLKCPTNSSATPPNQAPLLCSPRPASPSKFGGAGEHFTF